MADVDELQRAASAFPDLDDLGGITGGAPTGRTSFPALDDEGGLETTGFDGLDDDDDDDGGFGAFGGGGASSFGGSKAPPQVRVTGGGNDEVEKFESQFPDLGDAVSYA